MGHVPDDVDWALPVKGAHECSECEDCGEPWCDECQMHYSDCKHPGPDSERKEYDWELTLAKLFDDGYPTIPHQIG